MLLHSSEVFRPASRQEYIVKTQTVHSTISHNGFSMMRSVLKEWVPLYLFSKLAMDSALASDTPTMPVKGYRAYAASHPDGRNL